MTPNNIAELFPEAGTINASAAQSHDDISQLRRDIMEGRMTDLEPSEMAELPSVFRDLQDQLIEGMAFVEEVQAKIESMKQVLSQAMEANGHKKWWTDKMIVTYIEPSVRTVFDSKRFKKENEALYNEYLKQSETKGSVRITIKKNK